MRRTPSQASGVEPEDDDFESQLEEKAKTAKLFNCQIVRRSSTSVTERVKLS